MKPPVGLGSGNLVKVEIEGIGAIENRVADWRAWRFARDKVSLVL
jgi:2-keto-4-pentenoate hydratase/2-oxohepta-3-ene-1,7-dioic acid hydratase in catechol pathway